MLSNQTFAHKGMRPVKSHGILLCLLVFLFLSTGRGPSWAQAEKSVPNRDVLADTTLGKSGFVNPSLPWASTHPHGAESVGPTDKQARVYDLRGRVRMIKKDVHVWKKVKKGTILKEGDAILTDKESMASITFDEAYLNVVHIPENTRAVFRTIEPTDIHLEDGRLYNILDGLRPGTEWRVSTPVAVTAARGTFYLVNYTASNGDFLTATVEVPDDGQTSSVKVIEILQNGSQGASVAVPEGKQIHLAAGQSPDPSLLEAIDPQWLQQIEEVLEKLAQLRAQERDSALPPTGSESSEPAGTTGPTGPGSAGGDPGSTLDPLIDTGSALGDSSSHSQSGGGSSSSSSDNNPTSQETTNNDFS